MTERGNQSTDQLELIIDGPVPVQISEGFYDATVMRIEKTAKFKRPMFAVTFRLATDPYIGVELRGFAAMQGNGRIAPRSKFARWWLLIAEFEQFARRDRFSLRSFHRYLFTVSVGTVSKDYGRNQLGEGARWSVVREIVAVVGRLK